MKYILNLTVIPADSEGDKLEMLIEKNALDSETGCPMDDSFIHEITCSGLSLFEAAAMERTLVNRFEKFEARGFSNTSKSAKKPLGGSRGKPVCCEENGKVYESTRVAGRELNLDPSTVGKCCRGERNHTGGYHFSYV